LEFLNNEIFYNAFLTCPCFYNGIGSRNGRLSDRHRSKGVYYCTEKRLGRKPTWEDIARMHNGGPRAVWATGKKKENLDRYVAKVKAQLEK
jgi:hypothetical protein